MPLLNLRLAAPAVRRRPQPRGGAGRRSARPTASCGSARSCASARWSAIPPLARCRLLAAALPFVGHVATRNRGTVGGSIAHADAAAELPLCLLALGGSAVVEGPGGRRTIAAADLFVTHLTSSLEPDELLVEVRLPLDGPGTGVGFQEVAARHGDYALRARRLHAAGRGRRGARGVGSRAGAVADRPVALPDAAARAGRRRARRRRASRPRPRRRARRCEPGDGLHAPAAYRRHLVGVLVERAARQAWADATTRVAA